MNSALRNGFYLIYPSERKMLKEVIFFLENGFKWKTNISEKLLKKLTQQHNQFPLGAVHIDKGKITNGILLFYQGFNNIEKKHILSLSSWYANSNHRGIEALIFAKNLTAALDKFIITNYTPNQVASKIWKLLKFRDMDVKKISFGCSRKFPFFNFTIPFKFFTFEKNSSEPLNIKVKHSLLMKSNWYYKLDQTKKFSISVSALSIYSNKIQPKINIQWILKMFYRYRIVKINLFLMQHSEYNKDIWLIKNSNKVSLIPPTESELVIF